MFVCVCAHIYVFYILGRLFLCLYNKLDFIGYVMSIHFHSLLF